MEPICDPYLVTARTLRHWMSLFISIPVFQFAEKKLSNESETQIIWEGSGDAVHKTITCAEIMKKKFRYDFRSSLCAV